MKSNKIKFEAFDDYYFNVASRPEPAAKYVPDWWKDIPKYATEDRNIDPFSNVTVKGCAPSLDMITAGYILPLWSDINVFEVNGVPQIKYAVHRSPVGMWQEQQSRNYAVPEDFHQIFFKLSNGWKIKTPPGWSCLFIHPAAYLDLPFRSIDGIVDTDILETDINCPFVIRKGFSGVIEKGTPMVQVIPFKRENWESEYSMSAPGSHFFNQQKLLSKVYGYYASMRAKKVYK